MQEGGEERFEARGGRGGEAAVDVGVCGDESGVLRGLCHVVVRLHTWAVDPDGKRMYSPRALIGVVDLSLHPGIEKLTTHEGPEPRRSRCSAHRQRVLHVWLVEDKTPHHLLAIQSCLR